MTPAMGMMRGETATHAVSGRLDGMRYPRRAITIHHANHSR